MTPRRIVLVGFGAVAGDLARALLQRTDPRYRLGILLDPASASRNRRYALTADEPTQGALDGLSARLY
jgi:hypothetical protein